MCQATEALPVYCINISVSSVSGFSRVSINIQFLDISCTFR